MPFSLTGALATFGKGCNEYINQLKERVLPTPKKRKRNNKEEQDREGSGRRQKLMQNERRQNDPPHRKEPVSPRSQFATAARPYTSGRAPANGADTGTKAVPQSHRLPDNKERNQYGLAGSRGFRSNPTPPSSIRRISQDKILSPTDYRRNGIQWEDGSLLRQGLLTPRPWPRRYANLGHPEASPSPFAPRLVIGPGAKLTPFVERARAERFQMQPGSVLWSSFQGRPVFPAARRPLPGQTILNRDLRELEMLRQMKNEAVRRRPVKESDRQQASDVVDLDDTPPKSAAHQRPSTNLAIPSPSDKLKRPQPDELQFAPRVTAPHAATSTALGMPAAPVREWLKFSEPESLGQTLSVAWYEMERRREDAALEQKREDARKAKADAEKAAAEAEAMLVRASIALGEKPSAQISRESLQAAQQQADILKSGLHSSEVEFLEDQQRHLQRQRVFKQAAESTVKLKAPPAVPLIPQSKPAALPKKIYQGPQQEEVVDLLSSSEDEAAEEEDGDEADTLHEDVYQEGFADGYRSQEEEEEDEEEEEEEEEDDEDDELAAALKAVAISGGLPVLTQHQRQQHRKALYDRGDPDVEILMHKGCNTGLTRRLLACMRPRQWLNDEVMNVVVGMLQERDKEWRLKGKDTPKCHFFTTFFINRLYMDQKAYVYSNVSRWTKPKALERGNQLSSSILDCDRIIVPVHLAVHWTCAMIDLQKKELVYLDSMGDEEPDIMEALQRYIADEFKSRKGLEVDTSKWPIRYSKDIPKQLNGCDCGVFALMFAEHLARDAPLTFQQKHMEYFRVFVTAALMDLKFDWD